MSGGAGASDKTEKPTPRRLKEARREGRIARTPEVGQWAVVLVATYLLPLTMRSAAGQFRRTFLGIHRVFADPDPHIALALLGDALRGGALAVAPLAFGIMLVGVASSALQGGVHPAVKALKPQPKRLNPMQGLKRSFGPQGAWQAAKALIKSVILGLFAWRAVQGLIPLLVGSGALPLAQTFGLVWDAVIKLARELSLAGLGLAGFDYVMVRRRVGKTLRMTKDEVKREHKQSEGDPLLKGAIRSRQLAMSHNRMMSELADADVVLVNPKHVAVALKYDAEKGAPRVVAKGAGHVARRIRERATEHRIPMVEDRPLARALHASCEIGQEIPPAFYTAVAQVLAFVLSLKARGSAAGLHRPRQMQGLVSSTT